MGSRSLLESVELLNIVVAYSLIVVTVLVGLLRVCSQGWNGEFETVSRGRNLVRVELEVGIYSECIVGGFAVFDVGANSPHLASL